MGLTSITLGGFQVFDAPTTIPLGRLTFLFGPNSAGKSAVEDAIMMLGAAISNKDYANSDGWGRFIGLRRHWRRTGPLPTDVSERMLIGLSVNESVVALDIKKAREINVSAKGRPIDLTYTYLLDRYRQYGRDEEPSDDPKEWHVNRNLDLSYDGIPLLRFHEESEEAALNFSHPLLAGLPLYKQVATILAKKSSLIVCAEGWLVVRPGRRLSQTENAKGSIASKFESLIHRPLLGNDNKLNRAIFNLELSKDEMNASNGLRQAFNTFSDYFDHILREIVAGLSWSLDTVPASRAVPTSDDLTHLTSFEENTFEEPIHVWGIATTGKRRYKRLAESFLREQIGELADAFRRQIAGTMDLGISKLPELLSANLNTAFTVHLFIDRGYRLESEYKVILDKDKFESLIAVGKPDVTLCKFLVQLYLVDPQGRKFSFEEVGSGLGYVLPILCSVYDFDNKNCYTSMSFLQQPELHLHPALQAALGDVFIDAIAQAQKQNSKTPIFDKQLIIETHSEHLLLRILRRIRQTTNNDNRLPPELHVRPEDVCVVHMDPRRDETTTVKQLRISPDGEFLDHWPRGFFDERDKELFDE